MASIHMTISLPKWMVEQIVKTSGKGRTERIQELLFLGHQKEQEIKQSKMPRVGPELKMLESQAALFLGRISENHFALIEVSS